MPRSTYICASSACSARGLAMISRRSTSISFAVYSAWLATEVYSPAAIENAPAASPASPASTTCCEWSPLGAADDTGDQGEVGDQPVHRAEDRRPQPAAGDVRMLVVDLFLVDVRRVDRVTVDRFRHAHIVDGAAHRGDSG